MIRVIDVFSGIGGFSLGLESTGGFETVAFCEIEPFPREVLAVHWPEVPCFTDVRELKLSPGDADMIVGGFPCQDISVAGKGAGIEGERSGLWRELFRLVQECRPRWVLVENVSALRTRGADRVLSDLEAEGYACWPLVVGAWAVGAPHRRERVWIVAHLAGAGQLRTPQLEDGGEGQRGERRPNATERRALPRASELSNSDAGRCGREEHALQAGRDEPERTASGVGLADRDQRRRKGKRYTYRDARSPLHSQSFGNDADGRGKWPVGSPTGAGLEGQRADAGEPQEPESRNAGAFPEPEGERRSQQGHGRYAGPRLGCDGPRWPARPGEPQHEWEEPRLAFAGVTDTAGRPASRGRRGGTSHAQGDGIGAGEVARSPELALGSAAHGLPERLARRANRESLKALGNSVVPQVVAAIGRAILRVEADE